MKYNILLENNHQFINLLMHNRKTNFDKFIGITKSFFPVVSIALTIFKAIQGIKKMPDCQIITLALTAE